LEVVNNTARNRFEAVIGEYTAVLDYRLDGDTLRLLHAGTPVPLRGQGIAGVVTKAALEYARAQGYKVDPVCSYVAAFIRRYPEYQSLVSTE
jgi:predicted GNAT family acetyltransferase